MERKLFGILALALIGVFAISIVAAIPFANSENHEAIQQAIEDGDYAAWKDLMTAQFSEENFEKMVQMHELRTELREARESGDDDAVDELMAELKTLMPEGRGMGFGHMEARKGFGRGMGQGYEGCPFAD